VNERCLTVPGHFEYLAQIADFIEATARSAGWNEDEIYRMQMAVDEACSNIIEHAYGPNRQGDIQLSCCVQDEGDLVISIHDNGRPFDPTRVPEPPIGTDLENLPEGGLGMYFMRRLMDEVAFHFDEHDGNVLTMVKRRPQ
jgi:serine/threonine-protein kinase RsbW